jgi:type IV pilus assembly protein PilO
MRHLLLALGFLFGLIGLPTVSYFYVFRPTQNQIDRAKSEVQHMQSILEKLKEESAKNADFERANQELQQSVAFIEQRLPTNQEIDNVVRQVSQLAIDSGLQPPAIRTNKPIAAGIYKEMPIDMETAGSFAGYHNFLVQLEKLPRVMRIHNLKVLGQDRMAQQNADTPEVKVTFTLSIYFQEEQAESDDLAMATN